MQGLILADKYISISRIVSQFNNMNTCVHRLSKAGVPNSRSGTCTCLWPVRKCLSSTSCPLPPKPCQWKIVVHETGPWHQKVGDCGSTLHTVSWGEAESHLGKKRIGLGLSFLYPYDLGSVHVNVSANPFLNNLF